MAQRLGRRQRAQVVLEFSRLGCRRPAAWAETASTAGKPSRFVALAVGTQRLGEQVQRATRAVALALGASAPDDFIEAFDHLRQVFGRRATQLFPDPIQAESSFLADLHPGLLLKF